MSVIKGDTTYAGIIEIDGQLACKQCKTVNPNCKATMHMDFTDKFVNQHSCMKCGNTITATTMRDEESRAMWGD